MLGLLSLATLPVAVLLTRYSESYDLLHSALAIPLGLALGITAVVLSRRARAEHARTLERVGGLRLASLGKWLGVAGISLAAAATVAIAVYGLLVYLEGGE